MSVQTEINRITTKRNQSFTAVASKGVTVPQGSTLDDLPGLIAQIQPKINRNLLDNWYFVGGGSQLGDGVFPINQRGQTTYNGNGYGIDRWYGSNSIVNIAITSDGINITRSTGEADSFIQKINNPESLRGKKVTASLLATGHNRIRLRANNVSIAISGNSVSGNELNSITAIIPNDTTELTVCIYTSNNISTVAKAVKLELGSEQTLAHNEGTEENPVWVLNEVPDYGEELRKCQRYYQLFRTESLRPTYGEDCRPTMATEQPTKGTLTKGGVTYYTLSSES